MKHWSVDEEKLKQDPQAYAVWRLEQRINFGVGEQKIDRRELKRHWNELDIDPYKRKALELALQ